MVAALLVLDGSSSASRSSLSSLWTSTMLSTVLFLGGSLLLLKYSNKKTPRSCRRGRENNCSRENKQSVVVVEEEEEENQVTPLNDDDDDDVTAEEEQQQHSSSEQQWTRYFKRRLEHRLSFTDDITNNSAAADVTTATAGAGAASSNGNGHRRNGIISEGEEARGGSTSASEYSIDFYPKNRNWTHFETYSNEQKQPSSNGEKQQRKKNKKKGESSASPSPHKTNNNNDNIEVEGRFSEKIEPVRGELSAIWMSLEGDRAASKVGVFHHHHPRRSSSLTFDGGDDDGTTTDDGDDSQASSKDHFVWTENEYQAASSSRQGLRHNNKSSSSSGNPPLRKPPLPVILSERVYSPVLPEQPESGLNTPVFLSGPNSLQGSEEEEGDEDFSEENGDDADSRAAVSTASSLHFAPILSHGGGRNGRRATTPDATTLSITTLNSPPIPIIPSQDNQHRISSCSSPRLQQHQSNPNESSDAVNVVLPKQQTRSSPDQPRPKATTNPKLFPRTSSAPLTTTRTKPPRTFIKRADSIANIQVSEHRANYNARIMPHKLILIRHGQSMGNIDETMYSTTPDNAIPLTKLGWLQARAAGRRLREIVDGSSDVHFIVSPYVRTVETFHGLASAWCDPETELGHLSDPLHRRKAWYGKLVEKGLSWAEDPRIREQDFGNLQDPTKIKEAKSERNQFGAFYYRFAHGESAADVFDRISTFLDSLWRSFDVNPNRHFVLVTHGIAIRVLLARYFRYTINQFHLLSNPRNCEMIVLQHDGNGRLQLAGRHELNTIYPSPKVGIEGVTLRYQFKKRLRVLPQEFVWKVKTRICYSEEDSDDYE